jgi:uncharacterized membrane protein
MHERLHIALLILAVAGLGLSMQLTLMVIRIRQGGPVRCIHSCPVVMTTPYAQLLGFPNVYLALPFYSFLIIFSVLRLLDHAYWLFFPVCIAVSSAFLMSAYLVIALVARLKQPCPL